MEYALGAIKNKKDLRDVQLAQVQAPVAIPAKYVTDISFIPVLNQKQLGACVGHAHAIIHTYYEFKENKKTLMLSPRYLYSLSKKIDGIPGQQGTYPRVTAGIQVNKGCAPEGFVFNNTNLTHEEYINVIETPAITDSARPYKMKGYAVVASSKDALKQAIVSNGLVAITISVGNFNNPIKAGTLGLHRVVAYGFDGDRFFYRNSWGEGWGDNGNGYFDWQDQQLVDIIAFVDLPNEIMEEIKKKYKYFSDKEIVGLKPELVEKLDKARDIAGIPFVINSGYRTLNKNDDVGGVEDSSHLKGEAVDLRARNSNEHFLITKALMQVGFNRISRKYPNHIHVDIAKDKPQDVLF